MNIADLKEALLTNVVSIDFTDKNGQPKSSKRATLQEELLPARNKDAKELSEAQREVADTYLSVYDLDKQGFRRINPNNILIWQVL